MLDLAILIAAQAHLSVQDKGGKPYILHPLRLMMRLRTEDQELMSIAILHDVIEDSQITADYLLKMGFSYRVVSALKLLTHTKGESYEDYIDAMRTNKDALRVKREDLRDNSDITRLKGVSEKDLERMQKYHKAFLQIESWLKDL